MRFYGWYILLLFTVCILPHTLEASEAVPHIDSYEKPLSLAGEWKIILDDNSAFAEADYNDRYWDSFSFPGSVLHYSLDNGKGIEGVFWIRKKVFIDKKLSGKSLGLILGRIGNADETFFNGVKIGGMGGFPPDEYSMWNQPRHYLVPHTIIRYGDENIIAVRVSYMIFAEMLGRIAIDGYEYWQEDALVNRFLYTSLIYYMMGMGATLLIIFIIFFIRRPFEQEYLYYTLQLLFGFFVIIELCAPWDMYPSTLMRFRILGLAWVGLNVTLPIFLHRIYDLKRVLIERLLWIYFAIVVLIDFTVADMSNVRSLGLTLIIATIMLGFYHITCHVYALYRKRPYAQLFSFFGIAVVLSGIHDGIVYLSKFSGYDITLGGYHFNEMYVQYGTVLFYTGMAFVLVFRFIDMTKNVENLNANLEKIVMERTEQLDEAMQKLKKKNKNLTELALRDSLTGLYNHAAIHDRLDELLDESKRFGFSLCVIMIDLDDFKTINDTYGHQLGDAILIKIAESMKAGINEFFDYDDMDQQQYSSAALRRYDVVGRYGGDEFLVGLTNCTTEEARLIMERIRERLKAIHFHSYPDVKVAGSFGIAVLNNGTDCEEIKDLIAVADKALYNAKSRGGNDIYIYEYGRVSPIMHDTK